MINPIGEMRAPAGERSEMSDRTNQLRNHLSSNGYVSYGHQGIADSGASATLEPGRIFERIWPRLRLDAQKAFILTRSIIRRLGGSLAQGGQGLEFRFEIGSPRSSLHRSCLRRLPAARARHD